MVDTTDTTVTADDIATLFLLLAELEHQIKLWDTEQQRILDEEIDAYVVDDCGVAYEHMDVFRLAYMDCSDVRHDAWETACLQRALGAEIRCREMNVVENGSLLRVDDAVLDNIHAYKSRIATIAAIDDPDARVEALTPDERAREQFFSAFRPNPYAQYAVWSDTLAVLLAVYALDRVDLPDAAALMPESVRKAHVYLRKVCSGEGVAQG